MKNIFKEDNLDIKNLISKFFYWGLFLIILKGLNFWFTRGLFHPTQMSNSTLQIYANIQGVIYNLATLLIPIISIILLELLCNIIYLNMSNKK